MGKLLIIEDLDESGVALARGLALAVKLKQDVDVVAFTYTPLKSLNVSEAKRNSIRKRLLAERKQSVQARINSVCAKGQKVQLKVIWEKDIDRWVCKQCARGTYSTVVKTGNRSETLVHTSTDWQLLRECPAPVLLVAEKKWHRAKPVLVALDLSTNVASKRALNQKVLGVAQELAQAIGVELSIISAIEIPTLLADLDLVEPLAYERNARQGMQGQIRKLAEMYELPTAAFRSKRGPIEKVITSEAARIRAQIVVMGTVGRKGVKARLLGNTAERVLRFLKTDVLAIKP